MKEEETVIRFLILILAVCCLGMMYHLSEKIDSFNTQSIPASSAVTDKMPEIPEKSAPDVPMNSIDETEAFYIANPNTKKFHRIGCPEIQKMNPDHITIAASKELLEDQGYKGCKKCSP